MTVVAKLMALRLQRAIALSLALTAAWACPGAQAADSGMPVGVGPSPRLPAPHSKLIPTIHTARAVGWPAGAKPRAGAGLSVVAFADQLDHPRWVYALPNGDVLVAETNAPKRPDDGKGPKAWVARQLMKRAGAVTPSADRITLLRDTNDDGVADERTVFVDGLHSPLGMALVGNTFYVANTDAVVSYAYQPGQTRLEGPATRVAELPAGPRNHHWTKNLIASPDGKRLYASVGSNSNVAEHGMAAEDQRAAILEIDVLTGTRRVYASGLRNPVGMAWAPGSGQLWVAVNERDELGDDLVPDYITAVREGAFYGWPYSYFGQHEDKRVHPRRPDLVAQAVAPDYGLGAHTASLGLASSAGNSLGPAFSNGLFIGQHGSWNRSKPAGYQVIFVPFNGAQPQGEPIVVLDGFLNRKQQAQGRPVGVAIDTRGGLLVADDVGNVLWRVSLTP